MSDWQKLILKDNTPTIDSSLEKILFMACQGEISIEEAIEKIKELFKP